MGILFKLNQIPSAIYLLVWMMPNPSFAKHIKRLATFNLIPYKKIIVPLYIHVAQIQECRFIVKVDDSHFFIFFSRLNTRFRPAFISAF